MFEVQLKNLSLVYAAIGAAGCSVGTCQKGWGTAEAIGVMTVRQ